MNIKIYSSESIKLTGTYCNLWPIFMLWNISPPHCSKHFPFLMLMNCRKIADRSNVDVAVDGYHRYKVKRKSNLKKKNNNISNKKSIKPLIKRRWTYIWWFLVSNGEFKCRKMWKFWRKWTWMLIGSPSHGPECYQVIKLLNHLLH